MMALWLLGHLFMLLPMVIWAVSTEQSLTTPKEPRYRLRKWNVECYPDPQKEPERCQRDQKSFVCDPDALLSEEEANALDDIIETVSRDTPCLCSTCNSTDGVTIGVALLKNIYLNYNTQPSEEIKEFAEILRRNWKLGKCGDDILILVSSEQRTCHTDMGSSVASLLNTEITLEIFLENRHHFTDGHYYNGLESMIQSYSDVVRAEALKRAPQETKSSSIGLIVGLTVTFIVLAALLGGLAYWWTKKKRGSENSKRYSWEMSDSLKRSDIRKIQGPYVPVSTSDYQAPALPEKQKECHLESLNEEEEEEEIELEEQPKRMETLDSKSDVEDA